MFTGIIQTIGFIQSKHRCDGDYRFSISLGDIDESVITIGDSVAVSGVCLTVIKIENGSFSADVSLETVSRTTLGQLKAGSHVNLELALTPASRLGGHFVSGHVDGVGFVKSRTAEARSERFVIDAPENISRYIAEKGSICIEGVSLTVNTVTEAVFEVNIIPHTLKVTTIGHLLVGHRVNLEVDLLARYMERLLRVDQHHSSAITEQHLKHAGFL